MGVVGSPPGSGRVIRVARGTLRAAALEPTVQLHAQLATPASLQNDRIRRSYRPLRLGQARSSRRAALRCEGLAESHPSAGGLLERVRVRGRRHPGAGSYGVAGKGSLATSSHPSTRESSAFASNLAKWRSAYPT